MKRKSIVLSLVLVMLLSACAQQTPAPTQVLSSISTVVGETLTAIYTPATDTPTPLPPTDTPEPTPTFDSSVATTTAPLVATTASGKSCDNAVFANDVTIPDGTHMQPGQKFNKIWAIKNTGSCDWSETYALKFYNGNKMNGHQTAIGKVVYSGHTTTISISMTAPDTPGTYKGYWSMINDSQFYFGQFVEVTIIVD